MTHQNLPIAAPSRNSEYRWTAPKMVAFLRALAEAGDVARAAKSVGMSRQSAYRLRARLGDGQFGRAWNMAQRMGVEARWRERAARHASGRVFEWTEPR